MHILKSRLWRTGAAAGIGEQMKNDGIRSRLCDACTQVTSSRGRERKEVREMTRNYAVEIISCISRRGSM